MPQVPPGAQAAALLLPPAELWPVTAKVESFFCVSVLLQVGQITACDAWVEVRMNCSNWAPQVVQTKSNNGIFFPFSDHWQAAILYQLEIGNDMRDQGMGCRIRIEFRQIVIEQEERQQNHKACKEPP